eukprot:3913438-Pyramimonas_sp.AAC.1
MKKGSGQAFLTCFANIFTEELLLGKNFFLPGIGVFVVDHKNKGSDHEKMVFGKLIMIKGKQPLAEVKFTAFGNLEEALTKTTIADNSSSSSDTEHTQGSSLASSSS